MIRVFTLVSSTTSSSSRIFTIVAVLLIGLAVGFTIGGSYSGSNPRPTALVATTITQTAAMSGQSPTRPDLLEYCFSPAGSCSGVIIRWITRANSSIHILIYSFTLDPVRDALIQAKNRGVEVKIVMERSNANSSGAEYQNLKNAGIDVRLDTNSGDMHDKIAIIDSHILITGSYNYSQAANTRNNENLVVIDSQAWAEAYEVQFQIIYNASTP